MIPELQEQLALTRKELAETQAKLNDVFQDLSELRQQLQVNRPPQVALSTGAGLSIGLGSITGFR